MGPTLVVSFYRHITKLKADGRIWVKQFDGTWYSRAATKQDIRRLQRFIGGVDPLSVVDNVDAGGA